MRHEGDRAVAVGGLLRDIRRRKMWNQGELAERAGVSPTTVSGIESGRISRPHLGTIRKLARAMGVEPEILLGGGESATGNEGPSRLSLSWARAAGEEEFERGLDEASLDGLGALSRKLDEERGRLQKLYSEFPKGSEQQRFLKRQIRLVSAQSGSVTASLIFREQEDLRGREAGSEGDPDR